MHATESLPLLLLLVFASAKLFGEIAERLGVPALVGEIAAGVLLGPAVLGWVHPSVLLTDLAELGVLFLLFRVGLEVNSSELMKCGPTALVVAAGGVVLPLALGWGVMRVAGFSHLEALFTGAALVATSVGITAQVLAARGRLRERSGQIILAAAVIDDVLGLIVLAVVSSMARSGAPAVADLALAIVLPLVFLVVVARWGTRAARRWVPVLSDRLRASDAQFHLALVLLFALSVAAQRTGVAAIVGAFLAGMSLAGNVSHRVNTLVHGASELLLPFFLVGIGLTADPHVFASPATAVLAGVLIVVAILTKLVGCGVGALRYGRLEALRVGLGMVPRGEVGIVVAQLGLSLGVVSQTVYAVVVATALATTVVAPPLLRLAYRGPSASGDKN